MWLYENKQIDALPEDCIGFVYIITNTTNDRKYIGKKLSKFSRTSTKTVVLKNGTKKKKKVRSKVDSDWIEYYGSSIELQKDIETIGKEHFTREILFFCKSKAECSYIEAREQFLRRVLESDEYYNNNIMCRIHGSHIKGKI
jgi:5S rRNA maturation endonuclease (ribonuclease M5)